MLHYCASAFLMANDWIAVFVLIGIIGDVVVTLSEICRDL